MSDPTSTAKRARLWEKFRNKAYRDAFVESHLSTNIAAQIYSMREARGWTQEELADAAHMAQARISVMEDPSYRRSTLSTLKRLASAFDVALIVRFVPFSELLEWSTSLTPERLAAPNYDVDKLPPPVSSTEVFSGSAQSFQIRNVANDTPSSESNVDVRSWVASEPPSSDARVISGHERRAEKWASATKQTASLSPASPESDLRTSNESMAPSQVVSVG